MFIVLRVKTSTTECKQCGTSPTVNDKHKKNVRHSEKHNGHIRHRTNKRDDVISGKGNLGSCKEDDVVDVKTNGGLNCLVASSIGVPSANGIPHGNNGPLR